MKKKPSTRNVILIIILCILCAGIIAGTVAVVSVFVDDKPATQQSKPSKPSNGGDDDNHTKFY